MSGDVTSALSEEGIVSVGVAGDPSFEDEVGAEHGDELDIFGCVLEELFGERTFQPFLAFIVFVHLLYFGFFGFGWVRHESEGGLE